MTCSDRQADHCRHHMQLPRIARFIQLIKAEHFVGQGPKVGGSRLPIELAVFATIPLFLFLGVVSIYSGTVAAHSLLSCRFRNAAASRDRVPSLLLC